MGGVKDSIVFPLSNGKITMRSLRYLNTVLTMIMVLLTLNVYALWSATPAGNLLSTAAEVRAEAGGIPNAAKQRKDILDELKKVTSELSSLQTTMTDGSVRVRLEGSKD